MGIPHRHYAEMFVSLRPSSLCRYLYGVNLCRADPSLRIMEIVSFIWWSLPFIYLEKNEIFYFGENPLTNRQETHNALLLYTALHQLKRPASPQSFE